MASPAIVQILFVVVLTIGASGQPRDITLLRCCTLVEAPFVFKDTTKKFGYDGLAFEYFNKLRNHPNFDFDCSTMELFKDGDRTGFTHFIEKMDTCTDENGMIIKDDDSTCKCDVGIAGFGLNQKRMEMVDFLPPFAYDRYRVLTHVNYTTSTTGGAFFLTTFSPGVWASTFGLIVVFTLLKLLDKQFAPVDEKSHPPGPSEGWLKRLRYFLLKSKIPYRLRKAVDSTSNKMIGQSSSEIEGDHSSTRQRLLNFTILLCGLFLTLAYEATMTAALVQETRQSDFRNVDDLKNCRIPKKDDVVCIPGGGAVEGFWNMAIEKGSNDTCHENKSITDSYEELVNIVVSGDCKFAIALGGTLENAASGRHCGKLAVTGDPFFNTEISYVLPKGSPYTMNFSSVTFDLRNQDDIPSIEQYLERKGSCSLISETFLTVTKLRVFFFLAYGACFILFLVMTLDFQAVVTYVREKIGGNADTGSTNELVADNTGL